MYFDIGKIKSFEAPSSGGCEDSAFDVTIREGSPQTLTIRITAIELSTHRKFQLAVLEKQPKFLSTNPPKPAPQESNEKAG